MIFPPKKPMGARVGMRGWKKCPFSGPKCRLYTLFYLLFCVSGQLVQYHVHVLQHHEILLLPERQGERRVDTQLKVCLSLFHYLSLSSPSLSASLHLFLSVIFSFWSSLSVSFPTFLLFFSFSPIIISDFCNRYSERVTVSIKLDKWARFRGDFGYLIAERVNYRGDPDQTRLDLK